MTISKRQGVYLEGKKSDQLSAQQLSWGGVELIKVRQDKRAAAVTTSIGQSYTQLGTLYNSLDCTGVNFVRKTVHYPKERKESNVVLFWITSTQSSTYYSQAV